MTIHPLSVVAPLGASPTVRHGTFVTIRCGLKGWDKTRQRGVYQPFILGMQPVTLVVIYLMRPSSSAAPPLDWATLAFVPAALLGAWFGLRIFKRLSDRQFEFVVKVADLVRYRSHPLMPSLSDQH